MEKNKDLLILDLSARIHYGVKVQYMAGDGVTTIVCDVDCVSVRSQCVGIYENEEMPIVWRSIESIKPYLRPMSSMTEEERNEYHSYCDNYYDIYFDSVESIDWLNVHHFDYRGLILMGLALEAPDGMYK